MFQLIVAVISIALVAALAGASIYYGGTAFSGSTAKANVTSLINQGQQIAGAVTLYRTDHAGANPTMDDLTDEGGYMQSVPTPPQIAGAWAISADGPVAYIDLEEASGEAVCEEVVNQAGGAPTTALTDTDTRPEGVQFACTEDNEFFVFGL